MVIQQGGMPAAAPHQQLQPNWAKNQQARNSLPGANNRTMVSGLNQGRPNQPNQYTPNPVSFDIRIYWVCECLIYEGADETYQSIESWKIWGFVSIRFYLLGQKYKL